MSEVQETGLTCPECRTYFEPTRSDQGYCSTKCSDKGYLRGQKRGARVYRALYRWMLEDHDRFGENMRFVRREARAWINEDKAAQRLPPPPHNHDANRGHERPVKAVKL